MSYQGSSLEFVHAGNSSSHFERRGIVAVPARVRKASDCQPSDHGDLDETY
jgi:hypothetical protein